MAISKIIKVRCPCCRQSFFPGFHSELTCIHSYLLRVLKIVNGMTVQQMRELPRLSSYSGQHLGRLVSKLHQDDLIGILGTNNNKAIWGLPSKAHLFKPETKPLESSQDQREHELWRKSLQTQRRHVHEMRGRC